MNAPTNPIPPLMLTVQPQVWVNNYAVDTQPAVTFDGGPEMAALPKEDLEAVLDCARDSRELGDIGDHLYLEAADRGAVEAGFGPFYVMVDLDDLLVWIATRPEPFEVDVRRRAAWRHVSDDPERVTEIIRWEADVKQYVRYVHGADTSRALEREVVGESGRFDRRTLAKLCADRNDQRWSEAFGRLIAAREGGDE